MDGLKNSMGRNCMKQTGELGIWINENGGYDYYRTPRFLGAFWGCGFSCLENRELLVHYGDYIILHMAIQSQSIYLLSCQPAKGPSDVRTSIQNKLIHEYNNYFGLPAGCFKLTQYNMYALLQYVEGVKRKIDAGFDKYSKLLEENIRSQTSGYLKIGINNAFSLEELTELIDAYNRLYSLFYYVWENGVEEIEQKDIEQVLYQHNMVLESIHIGSEGILVSVGVELIVELVKAFVKSVFEANESVADTNKKELLDIASQEEYMATRQEVFQLITLLESYLDKKKHGCDSRIMRYVEIEIDHIVRKIEQLQGTSHIDIVA